VSRKQREEGERQKDSMIYKRGKHWHLDVMVNGARYREALDTTDRRETLNLEKKRVGEIQVGKGASKSSRDFARKPFIAVADQIPGGPQTACCRAHICS